MLTKYFDNVKVRVQNLWPSGFDFTIKYSQTDMLSLEIERQKFVPLSHLFEIFKL